jgi:threonine synthase
MPSGGASPPVFARPALSNPDTVSPMFSAFARLTCTRCEASYERGQRLNVCPAPGCGGALFARYRAPRLDRDAAADRPRSIWKWHEMMPVEDPASPFASSTAARAENLAPVRLRSGSGHRIHRR